MNRKNSPIRILLVDDASFIRESIGRTLESYGMEVLAVANAKFALEALKSSQFDLMILDYMMPGMDGISLLEKLRATLSYFDLKVIMLTERSSREIVLKARKLDVNHYLLKSSLSEEILISAISNCLGIERPGSQQVVEAPEGNNEAKPFITLQQVTEDLTSRALPTVVSEVALMTASSDTHARDLALMLKNDSALCARVLQATQSAAFATNAGSIRSIDDAIGAIGFKAIRNIALSIGLLDAFPMGSVSPQQYFHAWRHSFANATILDLLLNKSEFNSIAYMIGLCEGLGELALRRKFPTEYQQAIVTAETSNIALNDVERLMFGLSSSDISVFLAAELKFPEVVCSSLKDYSQSKSNQITQALEMAKYYRSSLSLASTGEAQISLISKRNYAEVFGNEKPFFTNSEQLRSDICHSTTMLTRPPTKYIQALTEKPQKSDKQILYVRPEFYSDVDPLSLALDSVGTVRMQHTIPTQLSDYSDCSVMIVADSPQQDTAESVARLMELTNDTHLPVLYLTDSSPDLISDTMVCQPLSLSMRSLYEFVGGR